MRSKSWIIGVLIVGTLITVFILRKKEWTSTQFLMDTVVEIKVIARVNPKRAIYEAFKIMHKIDSIASFEGNGEIARINRGENIKLSKEVAEIIEEGLRVGELTDGAFDITVRPLMELWRNFKEEYIPSKGEIEKVLPLIRYDKVTIINEEVKFKELGMKLDLSGIAKGYAVDLAVEELKSNGVKTGLVNAGGDIRVFGDRIWKIGIKDPRGPGIVKILRLKNQAVATSGDYERYFIVNGVRYHHILNPKTGFPASECVSVTVISNRTSLTDALATGVFVLGPIKGKALLDSLQLTGFIITQDLKFLQ